MTTLPVDDLAALRAAPLARTIAEAAEAAGRAIPPVWPLASSVAVNPYLGQTSLDLSHTAALLARVAGTPATMPRKWHRARINDGVVTDADLAAALAACPSPLKPADPDALKAALTAPAPKPVALPTVADIAADVSGVDWPGLIAERLGGWAAGYFDEGQALWSAPRGKGAYAAWRDVATHDLTPEIAGLAGFAAHVADAPEFAEDAMLRAAARLCLDAASAPTYLHQLLMTMGGWAQVARYKLWQAELAGGTDATLREFLTIRLVWEEALYLAYEEDILGRWQMAREAHAAPVEPSAAQVLDAILQEAGERAAQREIAATLAADVPAIAVDARPALQAAFCIDVRSEVFRRALESLDPQIRTLGFAGFFGVFASHRGFASDVQELRLPVLLNPTVTSRSGGPGVAADDRDARFTARANRAWGRFKLAAVSSFAFVEATGPLYLGKLVRDALGLDAPTAPNEPAPVLDPGLDLPARAAAAETVLRAMSLTQGFARLVILAGHGASVVNNPHASALHCGACGGYSGEVNARLLAALLNDPAVRNALRPRGIDIPADAHFVGALHDTTTDAVTLYDDAPTGAHDADIAQARDWLAAAGRLTRAERALRLPRAGGEADVAARSRDWAEVRPEWALAGCRAFIAAPRGRTAGRDLAGRAFLHDYDWKADTGFGVLELIMTAPVVVASWISLQYYGSTVSPEVFGGGDKLLHNVTGGIGVVEGNGGLLRVGLPWQSVHDGERLAHEPLRLSVCIEAPREAMTDILRRHDGVRALFDNRWLHLFALDDTGAMAWRYAGGLEWTAETAPGGAGKSRRAALKAVG